ncbi:MAG: nucleotidyltransferase domain-containing protein [archaeon]
MEKTPIERVYYAFYTSKKQRMYFNELRETAKMSISSLQNSIRKMEKSKEITRFKERANVFYSLKDKDKIAINFVKFDIQRLNNLNINVKLPVREFLEKARDIAFVLLFGSASRDEEKEGSDIDLLVVTYNFKEKLNRLYQKEIRKEIEEIKSGASAKSLYPLSITFVDEKEFSTRKDHLLEQAKKTGFCIYNQQYYYREILKDET